MKYLFTLCWLIAINVWGFGQKHTYKHFSVEDGLPSLAIYQVTQDKDGYIWIASDKGVSKYDGYRFRNFTVQDGLPTNRVWELYPDEENRIWLLADDAPLTYIKNDKVVQVTKERISPLARGIQMSSSGTVWANTKTGLFFLEGDSLVNYDTEDRIFIKIDEEDRLWLVDDFDNILYKKGEDRESSISLNLDSTEVIASDIFPFGDGLIFKTFTELCYFEDSLIKLLFPFQARLSEQFFPMLTERNQVFELDNNGKLVTQKEVLGDFRVEGVFKDREGNAWYYTTGDGLYLLTATAENCLTYGLLDGLEDQKIMATLRVDNILYVGTFNGDFYGLDLSTNRLFSIPLDNARYINGLTSDEEDIFLATDQGLFIFNKNEINSLEKNYQNSFTLGTCFSDNCTIRRQTKSLQIRGRIVRVRDMTWQGNTLMLATANGVWKVKKNTNEITLQKVKDGKAEAIAISDTNYWIGNSEGLFSPATLSDTFLQKKPIKDIVIDANGNQWIGTDGYGVYCNMADQYFIVKGTERDLVQHLFVNREGVWAATNDGLRRITYTLQGNNPIFEIRTFNAADGLATNEVNTLYATTDNLYIGTNKGLTIMKRESIPRVLPLLHITNVTINQRDTTVTQRINLKHTQNNITINYVGLSYLSNQNIRYEYKMEGIDRDWQTTKLTERNYPDLAPNTYTFRLRAIDVEGTISQEKTILFNIKPPFWATVWFTSMLIFALVAAIYAFIQWQTLRIKKREAAQSKIERERNNLQLKITEEQAEKDRISKELAQSKLETLQAQLNPHFAYNALTSIQKFILTNDKKEANKYLVKFARLMRQFLEASKERYITLAKELELLELYVEMEQLRFKDKFDYSISVDPSIERHQVIVPSMLLQIYIENAINHGLVYKEDKGHLEINILKKGNMIQCIVKDDGIGRSRAKEIKQQSVGSYKGLGMKISKERVRYLNMIDDKKVSIEILDDILGEGKGGTQVVVSIQNGELSE